MLFNSFGFLLVFLPLTLFVYFSVGPKSSRAAIALLGLASLIFYGWWDPRYLILIACSIAFNFAAGRYLLRLAGREDARLVRSWLLGVSIGANLALLGVFKYADFFLDAANQILATQLVLPHLVLPLGISFFTFTQIAFLVDASTGEVDSLSFSNYGLFVSFFPHLIAGPILHHREMMPQFERPLAARFNVDHFALGLCLLCIGLVKKLGVADQFAALANAGFGSWRELDGAAAWLTSLAYTIQLYFDFSGYTDMALGLGWMFNIRLPQNFNSPYKATSIQDFWRRWHMTLSRFLREYLYLPLGGNRAGRAATLRNLLITFLLGGLWHGAGWTFVLWGALHGVALCAQRVWGWAGLGMPRWLGWALTFLFVNFAWIYFRATSVEQANGILLHMIGLGGAPEASIGAAQLFRMAAEQSLALFGSSTAPAALVFTCYALTLCWIWLAPNTVALASRFRPSAILGTVAGVALALALLSMHRTAEFIYFNF